ncbi:MAG TPA: PaeR7I family type II restriction endonuclease [Kiritimatiellia bacterium]|nr:PaeR7I family type II restriction endonuclease [Kiritimatiellia bacterium]
MIERTGVAVAHYWNTRIGQHDRQRQAGKADQGARSAVTGGAQMDGFIDLFAELIVQAGIPERFIFRKKAVELPGFFRPTKEWDLLVVRDKTLLVAIEAKSQVGPSFGNNFNNRTEEAMGSALDLWTAYRERAYLDSPQPFLGYFSCWRTAPHPTVPSRSRSRTSRCFLNSSVHHTCAVTKSSAVSSFWSDTTLQQRSSLPPKTTAFTDVSRFPQKI